MRTLTPLALLAFTALLPAQNCARFPGEIFALTTASTAFAIAVGDLNGDGVLDVAATSSDTTAPYQGYAEVLLGDGRGGFSVPAAFPVGRPFTGGTRYVYDPIAIAIVELNGDGKPDLAVADFDDGEISVLLGDGSGDFSAATTFPVGGSPTSIVRGDFDRDGKADLAVTNRIATGDAQVTVMLGDGLGGFASTTSFALATNAYPVNVVCGDMNGDGALDLVTAIAAPLSHPNVTLLLGDGRGGFSAPAIVMQLGSFSDMDECGIADMNGDGKQDVIATYSGYEWRHIDVLLGDGLGRFPTKRTFPISATFVEVSPDFRLAVDDLNGDRKPDVVVVGNLGLNYLRQIGIVSVLLGDGQGGLSVSHEFASDAGRSLAIAASTATAMPTWLWAPRMESGRCSGAGSRAWLPPASRSDPSPTPSPARTWMAMASATSPSPP